MAVDRRNTMHFFIRSREKMASIDVDETKKEKKIKIKSRQEKKQSI